MIDQTTSLLSFSGNNSTVTAYQLSNFPLADAAHLVVTVTTNAGVTTTLTSNQFTFTPTVDGNGRITGGSATTADAVPTTSTIKFKRVTPRTQTVNLVQGSRLSAEALESGLDRIVLILQEIERDYLAADVALDARLDVLEA